MKKKKEGKRSLFLIIIRFGIIILGDCIKIMVLMNFKLLGFFLIINID